MSTPEPMHVRIVTPITATDFGQDSLPYLSGMLRPGTRLDMVGLETGPPLVETELDEALAVPGMLRRITEAAADGCDAVVLNCVGDPGLAAARDLVAIPVLGPGQIGMHLACVLGGRFSILISSERGIPSMESLVDRYGLRASLASVRALDMPILELSGDPNRLGQAFLDQARAAIEQDGAEVILLGSTGMTAAGQMLAERLRASGYVAPVIEPLVCAVLQAEALVRVGLSHHRHVSNTTGDEDG